MKLKKLFNVVRMLAQTPVFWLILLMVLAGPLGYSADFKEGGYVGTAGQGHDTVVYNFLKHFSYEQYYWAIPSQFTTNNNNRVDAMTIAFFAGHGSPWSILCQSTSVDLKTAGTSSHKGWGNVASKFVAFESCKVVPSPIETSDWAYPWTKPGGVFDGVHQVIGFRTNSWQSSDQDISDYFGCRMRNGCRVWQSWFDAIIAKGRREWSWGCWCMKLKEYGSAVMWPPAENDTYGSWCANPPQNHTWLKVWYQH